MPRQDQPSTSQAPGLVPPAGSPGLTDDQIMRCAELIAEGRGAFPDNLSPADHERLLVAVRQRLRSRLVHLIARAIAVQLHRQARPDKETLDART
jgi:hypothetical protein